MNAITMNSTHARQPTDFETRSMLLARRNLEREQQQAAEDHWNALRHAEEAGRAVTRMKDARRNGNRETARFWLRSARHEREMAVLAMQGYDAAVRAQCFWMKELGYAPDTTAL